MKVDIRSLESMVGERVELPKKDFRELRVVYFCTGEGREEECVNYSPGPGGKCSFIDYEFSELKVCRKE